MKRDVVKRDVVKRDVVKIDTRYNYAFALFHAFISLIIIVNKKNFTCLAITAQ